MDVCLRETMIELIAPKKLAGAANPTLFEPHISPLAAPRPHHLQEELAPARFRAIELENEFLKLTVLPELGGRVAGLYDKLAGRDIFAPLKQACGAGGLSFRLATGLTGEIQWPVNAQSGLLADGSGRVTLGGMDACGLAWQIELTLRPGRAALDQSVRIVNTADRALPLRFWSAAALPWAKDMEMLCPFAWRATEEHGYEMWPMDGALDSASPAGLPPGYRTFGKLVSPGHIGAHYPNWDYGVVHAAPRKPVKGAGFVILGEGKPPEIFCGPFEQPDSLRLIAPGAVIMWAESWFGARGIGPVAGASADAALAMERFADGVCVRLQANGSHEEARVLVAYGGQIQEQMIALSPDSPLALEYPGVGPDEPVTVDVTAGGKLLLSYGHHSEPMPEPPSTVLFEDSRIGPLPESEDQTPLERAMELERLGQLAEAADAYEEALCDGPESMITLMGLGRVRLARRQAWEAADCFERALALDNLCGEARFGLAAAKCQAGDLEQARRLYGDIACTDPLYEASLYQMAALNIRLGNSWENIALLECTKHPEGLFLLQLSRRIAGLPLLDETGPGPLCEMMLAEQFLSGGEPMGLLAYTGGREDALLVVALRYAALGCEGDCLAILGLIASPSMKTALARAACEALPAEEALAVPLSGAPVMESVLLDLLEHADDQTGRAQWLLGCLDWLVGQQDSAMERWQDAYDKGQRHSPLLYCLGQAHLNQFDEAEALRYLREDASLHGSENPRSLALLFDTLKGQGDVYQRLELLPLLTQAACSATLRQRVEALADGDCHEEALELLEQTRCVGGAGEGCPLWSRVAGALALKLSSEGCHDEAKIMAERILDWPEGLGYTRNPNRSLAEHHLVLGQVYRMAGDFERAREAFRAGAAEGGNPVIRRDAEAMGWVRRCMEEMRRL